MNTSDVNHELHELLDQLCAGTLSDSERGLLNEMLRSDDENCAVYLRYMAIHASLSYDGHGITSRSLSSGRETGDDEVPSNHEVLSNQVVQIAPRRPRAKMALAVATVCISLFAMFFVVPPVYEALTRRLAGGAPAEITGTTDALWVDGQTSWTRGAHLDAGNRLELKSGLVELWYPDGVRVVLEGPCIYVVEGRRAGRLQAAGSLRLRCCNSSRASLFTPPRPASKIWARNSVSKCKKKETRKSSCSAARWKWLIMQCARSVFA